MLLAFARRAEALVGVGAWADVAVQFGPAAGVVDGACLGDIEEASVTSSVSMWADSS